MQKTFRSYKSLSVAKSKRLTQPFFALYQIICQDRSSRPDVFCKRGVACNFIKKGTLAQVFYCEFSNISKNTCPYRTPLVAASVKSNQLQCNKLNRRKKHFVLESLHFFISCFEWHHFQVKPEQYVIPLSSSWS